MDKKILPGFYFMLIVFLLFGVSQCAKTSENAGFEKSQNIWTSRLCCESVSNNFNLEWIDIIDKKKIDIQFCELLNNDTRLSISLSRIDEKGSFITVFDLSSIESKSLKSKLTIPLNRLPAFFEGEFNALNEIQDGKYRLYLSRGVNCGEIIFQVEKGKKVNEKLLCIQKCK